MQITNTLGQIVFDKVYNNFINDEIEDDLFAYLGGICNSLDCIPIKVGGYRNHVHILCPLSKKRALVKLLEIVKANSSKWIKTKGEAFQDFYWQNGYGSFSVNLSQLQRVVDYIANQKQHHEKKSFEDECRIILKK